MRTLISFQLANKNVIARSIAEAEDELAEARRAQVDLTSRTAGLSDRLRDGYDEPRIKVDVGVARAEAKRDFLTQVRVSAEEEQRQFLDKAEQEKYDHRTLKRGEDSGS